MLDLGKVGYLVVALMFATWAVSLVYWKARRMEERWTAWPNQGGDMPTPTDRDDVQRLFREEHAQLVEVLPAGEFDDEHLPGAINIPLKTLDAESTVSLDPRRPVIVYCYDYQWDLSPRAASRLEGLGFARVYDYVAGKADWGSFGLPLEGKADSSTRVGGIARADAPRCLPDELVSNVAERVGGEWRICVVTNDEGVVLGLLGRQALRSGQSVRAEDAMSIGPSTIRPSARRDAIAQRMRDQDLTRIVVTRSDGTLTGVLRREDLETPSPSNAS
jgi:rhodanese-related sulfurtransferase